MIARLVNWLIARAHRTPYFHLHDKNGDLYMARYWLVPYASLTEAGCHIATWRQPFTWLLQKLGIAIRVHHIHREDRDRHMHDHPWSFVSVVLRGWYVEAQPMYPDEFKTWEDSGIEMASIDFRRQGSLAYRPVGTRHRIVQVPVDGVVTLFITFRYRQSWGFYTPQGKVPWRDYLAEEGSGQ
jgi:hypothetical protein